MNNDQRRVIAGTASLVVAVALSLVAPEAQGAIIVAAIVGGVLLFLPLGEALAVALYDEFHPEPEQPSLRVEVERLREKFPHLVINVEAFPRWERWEARDD